MVGRLDRSDGHIQQLGDLGAFHTGGPQLHDLTLGLGQPPQRAVDALALGSGNGDILG